MDAVGPLARNLVGKFSEGLVLWGWEREGGGWGNWFF